MFTQFIQQVSLVIASWIAISSLSLMAEGVDPVELNLSDAIAIARSRATDIQAAEFYMEAAQSRLNQASTWAYNPKVSLSTGLRRGSGSTDWDRGIEISQTLDIGHRRRARIAIAESAIEKSTAAYDEMTRRTLLAVAEAHLRARYMNQRVRIAGEAYELRKSLSATARKRHAAGDTGVLAQTLAGVAELRASVALEKAQADAEEGLSLLRSLLLIPIEQKIRVSGAVTFALTFDHGDIPSAVQRRPELQMLIAQIAESEALVQAAIASGTAQYNVNVAYEQEEDMDISTIGIGVSIPVFNKNNGERMATMAEGMAVRRQLAGRQIAIYNEITSALSRYERLHALVQSFTQKAIAAMDDNAQLSRTSYESGAIDFDAVLTIHREIIETRQALLEMQYSEARSGITLAASAVLAPFTIIQDQISTDFIHSLPTIEEKE